MIRLTLAALLVGGPAALAQPKAKPDPKVQLEAAVAKTLGGGPGTAYVAVLVTETPDKIGQLAKAGGAVLDLVSIPFVRLPFWMTGGNSPLPWVSPTVDARSSWAAEVAVFGDKKSATETITAFGLAQEDGLPRTWRLLKKTDGLAAAVKAADAEQAKLDKQAKANAKLTITRRPNPAPPAKK